MKEKKVYKIYTNRLLSLQLKKAILLAFNEAKKYGNNSVSSKFLLYAILKTNNNLATKSINNLYQDSYPFNNKVYKLLSRCESEFKAVKKSITSLDKENSLTFSRSVRRLLFSIIRSLKINNEGVAVINTFQVFNCLIRNKSLRKWIKQSLIDS